MNDDGLTEDEWNHCIKTARNQWCTDDDIEIDDGARVSLGDDPGYWVQAWVWVPDKTFHGTDE